MGALIDSSVLVAADRGKLSLTRLAAQYEQETLAISAVTAAELLYGVHRAVTPAQRAKRQAFVEGLLARMPVLPFDLTAARLHAEMWARLAKKGSQIGALDSMIGATALAWDLAVITSDERSFPKIPGLRVVVLKN
ncbi:MAG: PIN domain-containing protein [Candidatus Binataceae bacterium]|jgi:predicted nucleic acid-binding protein